MQLLLDRERYERVEQEARRTGRSVSAVIRGAIDVAYPGEAEARIIALRSLVEMGECSTDEPEDQWESIKESFAADLAGGPS